MDAGATTVTVSAQSSIVLVDGEVDHGKAPSTINLALILPLIAVAVVAVAVIAVVLLKKKK
jgi:hypothetical protein